MRVRSFVFKLYYLIWRGWLRVRVKLNTALHTYVFKLSTGSSFGIKIYFFDHKKTKVAGRLIIGNGVSFVSERADGYVELGDGVQINDNCILDCTGGLVIKDHTLISASTTVYTHSHGYDPRSLPRPKPLVIEENVWIGSHVLINDSVRTIGAHAIIGSGTILTKDVKPGTVVVGNPGRAIGVIPAEARETVKR